MQGQLSSFHCPLCPRKYTRSFNLRNHLRTHMGERPFTCGVCGRAFTRQHDCKTHEEIHSSEKIWICGGVLKNGEEWGCGRRYNRHSNLRRHFQSNMGRGCIKPKLDKEAAESKVTATLTDITRSSNVKKFPSAPSARPDISHAATFTSINDSSEDVDYAVAAPELLMWPSIKTLLGSQYYSLDYVIRLEEQRGFLSANGQGGISYTADDTTLSTSPLTQDGGSCSGTKSNLDRTSKVHGEALSHDPDVEIDQVGLLKLTGKVARQHYQNYFDGMHKLHPFLDKQVLDLMVAAFIKSYCFRTLSPTTEPNTCDKNKSKSFPSNSEGTKGFVNTTSASSRPRVEQNIDNAIILLVFALGAICECKFPLPGQVMDQKVDCRISLTAGIIGLPSAQLGDKAHALTSVYSPTPSGYAQMTTGSFYASLHTNRQPFPSLATESNINEKVSTWTTFATQDSCGHARDQPVIPGLALYRFATATLGHFQGDVKLTYIHACLLASLYASQLTHPLQSHGWISQAARACQLLLRQPRYEELRGRTKDLCNFAYWSCLQLESDLLAALDLPASGISRYKSRIDLPNYTFSPLDDFSSSKVTMMYFYSAQIHLHRLLNEITDLDEVEKRGQKYWSSKLKDAASLSLEDWRKSLPEFMKWEDTDEPAKDIKVARMRAMYYRIRYAINLPLLYYTLHYGQSGARVASDALPSLASPTGFTSASQTQSHHGNAHIHCRLNDTCFAPSDPFVPLPQGWVPPTVNLHELPPSLRDACRICVQSAILNTTAFDGIEDQLVLTNIFGTAHGQFGNMLVLSAIYNSSLSELVERSTLDRLFKCTIRFLLRSENGSPTLRADVRILNSIYLKIFGHQPVLTDA